jgi:hypothetical protein
MRRQLRADSRDTGGVPGEAEDPPWRVWRADGAQTAANANGGADEADVGAQIRRTTADDAQIQRMAADGAQDGAQTTADGSAQIRRTTQRMAEDGAQDGSGRGGLRRRTRRRTGKGRAATADGVRTGQVRAATAAGQGGRGGGRKKTLI